MNWLRTLFGLRPAMPFSPLAGIPQDPTTAKRIEEKRAEALAQLGNRWLLAKKVTRIHPRGL